MRQATIYPAEIKARILSKVLAPNAPSVVELAKEFNIPYQTLYAWKCAMLNKKTVKHVSEPQRPQDKSAQEKLQAVIDTIGKTESEKGGYCRQHGIYTNHLEEWKNQALESLGNANTKKHKSEHLLIINEVKQLKRDLHRKDKALAEVSALLILKKKADLIWGDSEDA